MTHMTQILIHDTWNLREHANLIALCKCSPTIQCDVLCQETNLERNPFHDVTDFVFAGHHVTARPAVVRGHPAVLGRTSGR